MEIEEILILFHQIPVLPPLCLHHPCVCHELLCIFVISWHLYAFASAYSVNQSVFSTLKSYYNMLGIFVAHMFPQYLQLLWVSLLPAFVLSSALFFYYCFFLASHCLLSFVAFINTSWGICVSTLLAHAITCSLVTSFVFLIAVTSHIILVIIIYAINKLFF